MLTQDARLDGNGRQAFLMALTGKLHELKAGTPEWIALGVLNRRFSESEPLTEAVIASEVEALGSDKRLNPQAIATAAAIVREVYEKFSGYLQFLFKGQNITVEEIAFSPDLQKESA